jgi:hypothetical protein
VTDDRDDQRDRPRDPDARPGDDPDGRRPVWERRIAIAVLVTFGAFVVFNLVVALVLVYTSAMRGAASPLGP